MRKGQSCPRCLHEQRAGGGGEAALVTTLQLEVTTASEVLRAVTIYNLLVKYL